MIAIWREFFYWDVASRRLRPDMLTSEEGLPARQDLSAYLRSMTGFARALEQARAFARAERDEGDLMKCSRISVIG